MIADDAAALARIRAFFAEEVTFSLNNHPLTEAFATVKREAFLAKGPWLTQNRHSAPQYVATPDANPRHLYHDHHVAIDATGFINSGGPGFNAFIFDMLEVKPGETVIYLGSGCGYYAAILGELVGAGGKVICVEVDPERAAQAGRALAPWPQVRQWCGNGATEPLEPCDVLIAGAGVTHPPSPALEALKVGGRMVFPLMGTIGEGEHYGTVAAMLHAHRMSAHSFAVRPLCHASYLPFVGARDPALAELIDAAMAQDGGATIASLRLDSHPHDPSSCWLHSDGDPAGRSSGDSLAAHPFCLSRLAGGQLHQDQPDPGVGLKLPPFNQLNVLPYGHPR